MTTSLKSVLACVVLTMAHCGGDAPREDAATAAESELSMSKVISPTYGITTFGGPGDREPSMACTRQSSAASQLYYVASSQRYGCLVHLRLVANGKCVVVRTEDAGPAAWVETRAGVPVLDASPAVATLLFGEKSLGWSDIKKSPGKYVVDAARTTLPLGPCDPDGDP
jgi:hypothetical protein